ncbi:MAG: hypothetical protein KCHDKBKB_01854 [Elusimicrobia bacterium]|nr:hypothetical protein [Elusimicrobiota bacterium]
MKALTVDYDMVAQSMRDVCRESNDYFFHKNSGRVLSLSRVLIRVIAERSEDAHDSVPCWEQALIPLAREIIVLGSKDYVRIPEAFGRPEHRWMLEFCQTVRGAKLREKLVGSLRGRESCRRFKQLLKEHIEENNRWHVYCQKQWEAIVQEWLASHSILAVGARSLKKRLAA